MPDPLREESIYGKEQEQYLRMLYHLRACAMCGEYLWCRHREPEVDLAAHTARLNHDPKKGNHTDAV
jgi:hypothetical protein